jgi:hypothetical protein
MEVSDRVPAGAQWAAAIVGTALTATGAVAVFVTNNAAGAGSLVAAGVVVGALGMFANKVQSVKGGGLEFVLAAAAKSTLEAAEVAEEHGRSDVAEALRQQAQFLASAAEPFAAKYEQVRRDSSSGWNRTLELERMSADLGPLLASSVPDRAAVEKLFDTGRDGNRWSAIAVMEHKPEIASPRVVAEAVKNPRSKFEQYHALKVIEAMAIRDPSSRHLSHLRGVIEHETPKGSLGSENSDRRILAERLLSRLPA